MNCPNCSDQLKMADRQGVEIDFCPRCRGVWLDRGELDKIIDRSGELMAPATASHGHHHGHKQPKSLLHELFDL